ncbi:MAG TPA: hypothetical protein VIO33_01175 [Burkholderiaceae bacterium]
MKLTQPRALWRIPPSWERDAAKRARAAGYEPVFDTTSISDAVEVAPSAEARMPGLLKAAFIFALLSLTVLERFGLRLSELYSVNPAVFAMAGMLLAALISHNLRLSPFGSLMYIAVFAVVGGSFAVNAALSGKQLVSLGSMGLLIVMYAPFAFTLRPATANLATWRWALNCYVMFAVFLAVCGVLQFYAQFAFKPPWLFDYTPMLPAAIRASGTYNTTNAAGALGLIKANGFFLREASGFSFQMAFALLCEWSTRRRKWVLAPLLLGLVVSYSGSGLLALAVAMLFPLGQRTVVRLFVAGVSIGVIVLTLGDVLNLDYTINRIGEFSSTKSSAYCRFISPAVLIAEQIDSDPWSVFLGHGPGVTQKMFSACETTYGKVIIEYGLLGALAIGGLVFGAIHRRWIPVRIRAALTVQWLLLGGNLLTPESLLLILYICGWWPERQTDAKEERPDPFRRQEPWAPERATPWKLPAAGPQPMSTRPMYTHDGGGLR